MSVINGSTIHFVRVGEDGLPTPDTEMTRQDIYKANPGAVRKKRGYSQEREVQVLRWLSTYIFNELKRDGVEVQAYYDTRRRLIIISTNTNSANGKLRKLLAGKKFQDFINQVDTAAPVERGRSDRDVRHRDQLRDALRDMPQDETHLILDAIRRTGFVVPDSHKDPERHAERRIHELVSSWDGPNVRRDMEDENLGFLAGVKRPCAACAAALDLKKSLPGLLWTSKTQLGGIPIEDVKEWMRENGKISHITQNRQGKLDSGNNTDSDSE